MIKYLYKLSTGETLRDYCKTYKLSYSTVYGYISKGFSVDEAVECAKKVKNTRMKYPNCYTYRNQSVHEYFKNDKNAYTTVIKYMRENNLTGEDAVKLYEYNKNNRKPRNTRKVMITDTGEIFNTIKECAEKLNVLPVRLSVNLKNGWKTKGLKVVYYKDCK